MCQRLRTIQQSIITYAGQFDARTLSAAQASEVVRLCAQIEASAASIKALAAARSAEGNGWQHAGYRSASEQLADQAGMSPAAAKRALETGRRLADQPEVAAAALAGDLSLEQATAISDGVAADPAKAGELIDKAKRSSLPELNEEVAKVKAACSDQEQRRRDRHVKRSLRRWTDRDGALQAHLYGHPEDGASLWRMLDPIRRRLNMMRRQSGAANESLDALDYDAVMTMAAIATGKEGELGLADLVELGLFPQFDASMLAGPAAPPPPTPADPGLFSLVAAADVDQTGTAAPPASKQGRRPKKLAGSPIRVMVRVDLDALLRGVALEGELCEIAGYGQVPVSVVEDLLATENPFIVGILTKAQALVGVYHHGHHPNAYQRSALDFLYPTCAAEGCSSRDGLQYDHRHDYAKTHFTAFDLLDRLCRHHHRKKTQDGWALVEGKGKRAFVPPDDSRHPRFSRHGLSPPPLPP
jgi:Domain of unknown function (DUF222)